MNEYEKSLQADLMASEIINRMKKNGVFGPWSGVTGTGEPPPKFSQEEQAAFDALLKKAEPHFSPRPTEYD